MSENLIICNIKVLNINSSLGSVGTQEAEESHFSRGVHDQPKQNQGPHLRANNS